MPASNSLANFEPMYATAGSDIPSDSGWTYEPKFDGMRVLALVTPDDARLVTRNGKEKTAQFPEVVSGLRSLGQKVGHPLLLDGEVVALEEGEPGRFQALQGRMHLQNREDISRKMRESPAALMVFDILVDGRESLVREPWTLRRERVEDLLNKFRSPAVRLAESTTDGTRMIDTARRSGWEGVIAKRTAARYSPGTRSRDWLKLKLQYGAEFVVGGYTEPRRSRSHLGALLLGYFDESGRLCYVGHTGGGFSRETLEGVYHLLAPLERAKSPFTTVPRTNERAHWVTPEVVVEVKFAEWTADGKLRQPIFLGVRDDKDARAVHLERESVQRWGAGAAGDRAAVREEHDVMPRKSRAVRKTRAKQARTSIVDQIDEILAAGGDGMLQFGGGRELKVSSLDKPYFPEDGITKGDLMRYYAQMSPVLLPATKDRPLILKRYPDGIGGSSFFQQSAGKSPPESVRTEELATENGTLAIRLVGGDLLTLLYTVQIGTIAVHPWQSRVASIESADYSTIDLDPAEGVSFTQVVELARILKHELDALEIHAALKTSGSRGLHIVVPLPRAMSYEDSAAFAQRLASHVAEAHPELATVERRLKRRPPGTIYVDAQQNARGKSMVSAYSVRARAGAPVSAPLRWTELRRTLRIEAFTLQTMPARLARTGDLWRAALARRNTRRAISHVLEA